MGLLTAKKSLYSGSLFSIFCLIVLSSSAFALSGRINKKDINIRADSTVTSPVIGVLSLDENVDIIQERYGWYKINIPDRLNYYVSDEHLIFDSEGKARISANKLNIRSMPCLEAPVIGKIKKNTIVKVIRKNKGWAAIESYPYARGWIHKKFIDILPGSLQEQTCIPTSVEIFQPAVPGIDSAVFPLTGVQRSTPAAGIEESNVLPPVARGYLRKLKQGFKECAANYILESDTGLISLKIDKTSDIKDLLNKQVKIWGKVEEDVCVYIAVTGISLL